MIGLISSGLIGFLLYKNKKLQREISIFSDSSRSNHINHYSL